MRLLTVVGIVLLAVGATVIALGNARVQDFLVDKAIHQRMDNRERNRELFADDAMRLLVCGSSSPLPSEDRARPCLAVIAGGRFYVVDTGSGSWNRMALLRMPGERIGAVLLTHFHSDHIGDLGEFNLQTWAAGRDGPLTVYGPAGVERIVAGFQEAYALDTGYRVAHHSADFLPPEREKMVPHPLTLSADGSSTQFFDDGALKISVFAVDHKPIEPAVGYRFDYKGRSIVISGDTVKDVKLVRAAQGADLLAHEAQNNDLVARMEKAAGELERPRMAKIFHDIPSYHTSPVEAAEVANEAGVAELLMYHLTPPPPNAIAEHAFLRGVRDIRPKGVTLARDGMLIELPLDGSAARFRQLK